MTDLLQSTRNGIRWGVGGGGPNYIYINIGLKKLWRARGMYQHYVLGHEDRHRK
jgi:hypothetical protein